MSKTCDQTIHLEESINTREKLLKLAELGSNNNNNNNNGSSSKKKQLKKFQIINKSAFRNKQSANSSDLSFTENIEHLACSKKKGISNVNFEDDDCKNLKNSNNPSDRSQTTNVDHVTIMDDHRIKIHPHTSVLNSQQYVSTRNNGQIFSNNPYSDLYSRYHEFRQRNMPFLTNDARPHLLRMHYDHSNSSLINSNSSDVRKSSHNVTFIPIYNPDRIILHNPLTQGKPQQYLNASQFSNSKLNNHNYNSNNNNNIIPIETTRKVFDRQSNSACLISGTEDDYYDDDGTVGGASIDDDDDGMPSTNETKSPTPTFTTNGPKPVHSKSSNSGEIPTGRDYKMLSQFFNRINTFIMDEDNNYPNSPKKILTNKNDYGNMVVDDNNKKILSSHSSTSPNRSSINNNNNNNDVEDDDEDDLLQNLFLASLQKNSIMSINGLDNEKKITESPSTATTAAAIKSSSCDKLDDVKFKSVDKFKSENDLLAIKRNDLAGISHLKEEDNPEQEQGVLERFRKKFSIRRRSQQQQQQQQSPIKSNNSPAMLNNVEQNSSHFVSPVKNYGSSPPPLSPNNNNKIDINQNQIDVKCSDRDKFVVMYGSLSPRESRRFNRKSSRKMSRKHARLKRSYTQPFDGQKDEFHEQLECKLGQIAINHEDGGPESGHSQSPSSNDNSHNIIYAEAIFDYSGSDNEELSFNAGDLIKVTDTSHKQWWWGAIKAGDETRYGWFPATYVRLKVSQEPETIEESLALNEQQSSFDVMSNSQMRTSISKLSSEQVRANVVLEIFNTEKDFVKNLKDVIDGYLKPCRDRKDMFDETRITTIFGNIEELYVFQNGFLAQLEQSIDQNNLSQSCVGNCFLQNEKGFTVYCEFCKNHPLAISELQDLYTDHKYVIFFEGCRLLQNMIDISLDGFLLTPIQKICKYPLQLAELLKYTKPEHEDYQPVSDAYKCMQRVAQMVNERKSRFENLEKLLTIEESFENWEGPPLLDTSSILIHSGEITRITRSSWSKELTLFLFDHLLVLAKKDTRILKKRTYLFKTRINLDNIDPVVALDDNTKDEHFHVMVKNSFKFYNRLKQKWYLFQAKTAEEKQQWIQAFEKERRLTKEDEEQGFVVTEQDKKGARLAHLNNLKPKKPKASRKPYPRIKKPDTVIAEIPLGPLKGFEIDRNRAGSLPSYIHNEKQLINLYKNRQSTMMKKTPRSNWFQLGSNKNKNRIKRTKS